MFLCSLEIKFDIIKIVLIAISGINIDYLLQAIDNDTQVLIPTDADNENIRLTLKYSLVYLLHNSFHCNFTEIDAKHLADKTMAC